MTDTSRETTFKLVLFIGYPVQFYQKNDKNQDKNIRALIDSGSKVNTIYSAYTTKLDLYIRKINVGTQKISRSHLDIFRIVMVDCSVKKKLERVQFF